MASNALPHKAIIVLVFTLQLFGVKPQVTSHSCYKQMVSLPCAKEVKVGSSIDGEGCLHFVCPSSANDRLARHRHRSLDLHDAIEFADWPFTDKNNPFKQRPFTTKSSFTEAEEPLVPALPHGKLCATPIDVVIMLDATLQPHLGKADFEMEVYLARDIVHGLLSHVNDVRVGLMRYSAGAGPEKEFYLNEFDTMSAKGRESILKRFSSIAQPSNSNGGGVPKLGVALKFAQATMLLREKGNRRAAANVLIVMTSGNSADDATAHADELRKSGVTILTVIVGKQFDTPVLLAVAGEDKKKIYNNVLDKPQCRAAFVARYLIPIVCSLAPPAVGCPPLPRRPDDVPADNFVGDRIYSEEIIGTVDRYPESTWATLKCADGFTSDHPNISKSKLSVCHASGEWKANTHCVAVQPPKGCAPLTKEDCDPLTVRGSFMYSSKAVMKTGLYAIETTAYINCTHGNFASDDTQEHKTRRAMMTCSDDGSWDRLTKCLTDPHPDCRVPGVVSDNCHCPLPAEETHLSKCEKKYKYVSEAMIFGDALSTCQRWDRGTLVTIYSTAMQSKLYKDLSIDEDIHVWIGLHRRNGDHRRWQWTSGSHSCFTNWAPREPNNFEGGAERQVQMIRTNKDELHRWNDMSDQNVYPYPFVCETCKIECPLLSREGWYMNSDGKWAYHPSELIGQPDADADERIEGEWKFSTDPDDQGKYFEGTTSTADCAEGHVSGDGKAKAVMMCTEEGKWVSKASCVEQKPKNVCKVTDLSSVEISITGSWRNGKSKLTEAEYKLDTTVTINCTRGYMANRDTQFKSKMRNAIAKCTLGGVWSTVSKCIVDPFPDCLVDARQVNQNCDCPVDDKAVTCEQKYYNFVPIEKTYAQAMANCKENFNGSLVTITDREMQENLLKDQSIDPATSLWIGLNRLHGKHRRYSWESGSATCHEDWATGEPNDEGDEELVVHIMGEADDRRRRWNDARADLLFASVCESCETERQTKCPPLSSKPDTKTSSQQEWDFNRNADQSTGFHVDTVASFTCNNGYYSSRDTQDTKVRKETWVCAEEGVWKQISKCVIDPFPLCANGTQYGYANLPCQCPGGDTQLAVCEKKYDVFSNPLNFREAVESCKVLYNGTLATITDAKMEATLRKDFDATVHNHNLPIWLGLNRLHGDHTRWSWTSGSSSSCYTNWGEGEPREGGGECVVLEKGKWVTRPSDNTLLFVCEWCKK